MTTDSLPASVIVKKIYALIECDIYNLKSGLEAETPEEADVAWHHFEWDVDDWARFACSCTAISTLLGLLSSYRLNKSHRDMKFEKMAKEWAGLL